MTLLLIIIAIGMLSSLLWLERKEELNASATRRGEDVALLGRDHSDATGT